ncbi:MULTISPECIES: phage holin, lambda family [Yersinia]|uniref:Phage holin n=1 Tax=Yersinia pekkanenii TaxID=1288385 RepID=A0A0T9RRG4_9GAMM|nr:MULTISPECIES: phage holin, lambda family [Yersinia]CND56097.1 phage holin [Yersinia pseudotuberculosis]CNI79244.1 phage holin [Yersinia pekkanenii]CQH39281.1 phage holin [Yersinia pseudotuberculosis]CRY69183.1 phage holin [Yersinia pekkanenii]
MRMHNEPHTWNDWGELLYAWWRGDVPLGGVLLSVVMAGLRVAYTGGGWKKTLLEGLTCGALTLTAVSALEYLDLPQQLTLAVGGLIGFIGVEQIRAFALRIVGNRIGGSDDTNP